MTTAAPLIRHYRDSHHDAVYDICVRTADAGGDARGQYSTDDLMGDLFAGPYLHLEPGFAFVLDDGHRDGKPSDDKPGDDGHSAVGYVLGTPDTAAFVRARRERWIPGWPAATRCRRIRRSRPRTRMLVPGPAPA